MVHISIHLMLMLITMFGGCDKEDENFNTSHVNVNHAITCISGSFSLFQYISC